MAEKEYIEREALEKFVSGIRRNLPLESPDFITRDYMLLNFEQYIHLMPAADVAPVKHGHFRRLTFSNDTIICSECKMAYNIFETNGAENFNFCPHCGTKIMDGGEGK